jgi:hypothetical protein
VTESTCVDSRLGAIQLRCGDTSNEMLIRDKFMAFYEKNLHLDDAKSLNLVEIGKRSYRCYFATSQVECGD